MFSSSQREPEFLRSLTPASQLMMKRRLEMRDFAGADFLMQSENAETRRNYELWKVGGGGTPIYGREYGSGPGRLGLLETDLRERRRTIEVLLNSIAKRDQPTGPRPSPRSIFTSSFVHEKHLTVIIPCELEEERFVSSVTIELS